MLLGLVAHDVESLGPSFGRGAAPRGVARADEDAPGGEPSGDVHCGSCLQAVAALHSESIYLGMSVCVK